VAMAPDSAGQSRDLIAAQPWLLAMAVPALERHLDTLRRTEVDVDGALRVGRLTVWSAPASTGSEALPWWVDSLRDGAKCTGPRDPRRRRGGLPPRPDIRDGSTSLRGRPQPT
jgi:hypothetical protein